MTGNYFGWNGQSIAIEHGQDNRITDSRFVADNESIALWMNDQTDPNFAYAKARDCSSRNYVIARNEFVGVSRNVFNLTKTKNILLKDNVTGNNQHLFLLGQRLEDFKATGNQFGGAKENVESSFAQWQNNKWLEEGTGQKFELPKPMVDGSGNELADLPAKEYVGRFETMFKAFQDMKPSTETLQHKVAPLKGGMNAFLPKGTMRGRRYILVDEWGPYDFRSPKIWPRGRALDKNGQTVEKFEVLGPVGKWKLVSVSPNVTLSAKSGTTNQMLEARLQGGKSTNVRIVLEYTGKETVDYRGVVTPAGKPVKFQFERFVAPIDWTVNFYQWEKEKSDPRTQPEEFAKVLEGTPIHTMKTQQLDVAWYGEPFPGGPKDYFATVSNGSFEIDPGSYVLSVTADDGVRVKLDGKLIIDEWHYSGPTTYERTVKLGGKHTIEINQFEIDGYSTIKCDLRPAR